MEEIRVIAELRLGAGQKARLTPALAELVAGSRAEKGNLAYDLLEDLSEPDHLFFVEKWASEDALTAHNNSAHFLKYRLAAGDDIVESRITKLRKAG